MVFDIVMASRTGLCGIGTLSMEVTSAKCANVDAALAWAYYAVFFQELESFYRLPKKGVRDSV